MGQVDFPYLALEAGDKGRLHGERVGGGDEGVRHGVHVVGEVEHEGSEGGLVEVENLWGGTGRPVEGESVRMSHMPWHLDNVNSIHRNIRESNTYYRKITEVCFTHIALRVQTCSRRGNQIADPSF